MTALRLRRPSGVCFALLLFVGVAAAPRLAAAQQQGAQSFIENLGTQALQLLRPSVSPTIRVARFRQMFSSNFDMPEIARFTLGPYRHRLSPEQQAEFRHLLTDYLARTYAEKLKPYAGDVLQVYGSRPYQGGTMVYSRVLLSDGNPVELDWVVSDNDGRHQISDVYVNQVSMKLSERNQFAGIAERNGGNPDAMIAALRQQLAVGS